MQVRCDAQNGAAAEEAHYVTHGAFLSGQCSALPGFVGSPDVLCTMTATDTQFTLVTAGPYASIACVYSSIPTPGEPNLVCS